MTGSSDTHISIKGMPYKLTDPEVTLATIKARSEFGEKNWRCRFKHKYEVVAEYDALQLVEESGGDPVVMTGAMGLTPFLGEIVQCTRCGTVAERNRI